MYSSSPGISRLVALKSEHEQLKLSHDNLMRLYRRLKKGNTLEISAIIEEIKSSDEILDMSKHKARLSPFVACAQPATDQLGLVYQNKNSEAGSSASTAQKNYLAFDQTPKPTSSHPCISRYADSTGILPGDHENSCHGKSRTTKWHATFRHVAYTNAGHESAIGFSPEHEPLLKGLLSFNIDKIRLGFTILRSWNIESRKVHNIEEFDHLFSILCHGEDTPMSRSGLCEICAVAATSGQYVRHLLAPGLINYWYGKLLSRCLNWSYGSILTWLSI